MGVTGNVQPKAGSREDNFRPVDNMRITECYSPHSQGTEKL